MKALDRPEMWNIGISPSAILPDGWSVAPLKRFFRVVGGATPTDDVENWDGDIPWVTPGDLSGLDTFYVGKGKRSISERGYRSCGTQLVPDGSVIVSTRAPIGSLAIAQERLCTNQGCKALVPTKTVDSRFFAYALSIATPQLNALGQGSTFRELSGESLGSFRLPVPSHQEQCRIAAFLDHETARIDELVREQELLRAQLYEKRSAVISVAATTGLDDDAPTRESGVSWLGRISSEWPLIRLLHVSRIRSGLVDPTDERFVDFALIAPNHVESETGRLLELSTAREQGAISGKYRCYHGDVIYSKIRPALAKACLSPGDEVLCSADMYAIAPGERLLSEFLLLFLLSDAFTRFAVLESDRVAMPKINQESLKDCWIPLPPIHEQQAIVERAFAALNEVDALLDESNRLIDLLAERRSALITAGVTGQLDLPAWQPPQAVAEVA